MNKQRKLSANGWTVPIILNGYQHGANAFVGVKLSTSATLTFNVFQIVERIKRSRRLACNITRATTTATVTLKTGSQPKVGDLVLVENAGGAPLDGWYPIASVSSQTVFTYTVANSGLTQSEPGTWVTIVRPIAIAAGLTAQTADAAAALAGPVSAVVMSVTGHSAGDAVLTVSDAAP